MSHTVFNKKQLFIIIITIVNILCDKLHRGPAGCQAPDSDDAVPVPAFKEYIMQWGCKWVTKNDNIPG